MNQKYGQLASLKMGPGNMIVIGGDGRLIRELLDKRGSIYSNRPLQIATEIAAKGSYLLWVFLPLYITLKYHDMLFAGFSRIQTNGA